MHHVKYRDLPDIIVCTTDNYEKFKYLETESGRIDCYMPDHEAVCGISYKSENAYTTQKNSHVVLSWVHKAGLRKPQGGIIFINSQSK